ncbi:MAG: cell division protein SepF [Saccharofermentans sp.]|nr:cell division protein SepF [Saccharofermentans sp.]
MGAFKNFLNKFIDETEYEEEMNEYDEYETGYETYDEEPVESFTNETAYVQPEPQTYIQPVAAAPVRPISTATVVMLSPYDIRSSQVVCDHIREGHIVICNLTPNANNQRVVDYISGAVYTLDGRIEPTPVKTTFVCTPKNVDLISDTQASEESISKVSAL